MMYNYSVTNRDFAEIWRAVAQARAAKGDTAGAEQALVNAAIFEHR